MIKWNPISNKQVAVFAVSLRGILTTRIKIVCILGIMAVSSDLLEPLEPLCLAFLGDLDRSLAERGAGGIMGFEASRMLFAPTRGMNHNHGYGDPACKHSVPAKLEYRRVYPRSVPCFLFLLRLSRGHSCHI